MVRRKGNCQFVAGLSSSSPYGGEGRRAGDRQFLWAGTQRDGVVLVDGICLRVCAHVCGEGRGEGGRGKKWNVRLWGDVFVCMNVY